MFKNYHIVSYQRTLPDSVSAKEWVAPVAMDRIFSSPKEFSLTALQKYYPHNLQVSTTNMQKKALEGKCGKEEVGKATKTKTSTEPLCSVKYRAPRRKSYDLR